MAEIHPGATLTPHFRAFLPGVAGGIPMTYRGAPLSTTDTRGLIATAEHSVLGTAFRSRA